MKLLVIGQGGREHAIAWRLAQNPRVSRVFVAPGNAGTAQEDGVYNIPFTTPAEWLKFAQDEAIALTVVGPEAPLAAGVVDLFQAAGLKIFGPTQAAAQLESSKDFAKQFMVRHGIPTAQYATFSDAAAASTYLHTHPAPIVIKADGLAAGKGVVVAMTDAEAQAAIDTMLGNAADTPATPGARVVIEAFMAGEEASFICLCDGQHALPFASSQDHKRIFDGDQGPNTGGMGAYSPAPIVTPAVHARVMREIITPTLKGMAAEGMPFVGFLYAGLMIDAEGNPRVVEFNARLGDPETQPILMRLKSDLLTLIEHAVNGSLDRIEAEWDRRAALGVVMAAAGYPGTPALGDAITGIPPANEDTHVFHAGTTLRDGHVLTHGGRVLCVTALGDTIKQAQQRAYATLAPIHFAGMQYRQDIGWRALAKRSKT
ncbi:MAG: phosphoribosylamine--glycine ligase [Betaproteobacteria bacterium]|nr:phosphoribosylamine--glycine ligase [Betaproteobacteria bacterium]